MIMRDVFRIESTHRNNKKSSYTVCLITVNFLVTRYFVFSLQWIAIRGLLSYRRFTHMFEEHRIEVLSNIYVYELFILVYTLRGTSFLLTPCAYVIYAQSLQTLGNRIGDILHFSSIYAF